VGSPPVRRGRAAAADRADWRWRRPYWWRFEDIGLWCRDSDDQAVAEWCAHRCPIRVNGQQRRAANSVNGIIDIIPAPGLFRQLNPEERRFQGNSRSQTHRCRNNQSALRNAKTRSVGWYRRTLESVVLVFASAFSFNCMSACK
jgi:hypothetical protein